MTILELILSIAVITLVFVVIKLMRDIYETREFLVYLTEIVLEKIAPDVLEKAREEIKRGMRDE